MPNGPQGNRSFPVIGTDPRSAPDYRRTVSGLSYRDLVHELEIGKGSWEYRAAVSHELERRRVPKEAL